MNRSGKALTIFSVIIAILLISLTAISMFFFQEETKISQALGTKLDELKMEKLQVEAELVEIQKELSLEEKKNKEADDKIESLMGDLELEQGLTEAERSENQKLQNELENEKLAREQIQKELREEIDRAKRKVTQLEEELANRTSWDEGLKEITQQLHGQGGNTKPNQDDRHISPLIKNIEDLQEKIDLRKIVVDPTVAPEGRVLNVDIQNEFIILNLGQKDGINKGEIMSIYRDDQYLGDTIVTRVQPEMSAADFVPPLSVRKIRKNDRVIKKQ